MKAVRLMSISILITFGLIGCKNQNLSFTLSSRFSIKSPPDGAVYKKTENSVIPLSGYCSHDDDYVLIIEPIRQVVPCVDNKWTHSLDLNIVPEGQFEVKIGTPDETATYSKVVTKRFYPEYLSVARKERSLSFVSHLVHTSLSAPRPALVYVSDEACQLADCPTTNIVVRLRSEDYRVPYHLTQNLYISSIDPKVAVLPNGDLRVFYLSSETPAGVTNLYYRDFSMASKTSSEAVKLADDVSELEGVQRQNGVFELFYLSKEYCDLNGCTAAKVSWRSSTDGYSSVNFPHGGLANQCEVSYLRTFHQENTNTIHLVYHLSDSGSCTVTSSDNTEHLKENGGSWSSIRFGTRHFGASQLGVTGAGVVYLFTRSTWSNPCSTWSLVYQSSADGFSSTTEVPSSCPHRASYPNDRFQPEVLFGENGELFLLTEVRGAPTSPKYSLQLSNSVDGFNNAIEILPSDFSGNYLYPKLLKIEGGFEVFTVQAGGGDSGLIRNVITDTGTSVKRVNLTGPLNQMISPTYLEGEGLRFIGTSKEWCEQNGCDNFNYYLENPLNGVRKWLTNISQDNLELAHPIYISLPSGTSRFFYGSNEASSEFMNTVIRKSDDQFQGSSPLIPANGANGGAITGVDVDPSGVIHIGGVYGSDAIYANSNDNYTTQTKVNVTGSPGTNRVLIRARSDGEVGFMHATNAGGSWSDKLHSSVIDITQQLLQVPATTRYRGISLTWDSTETSLEVYALQDGNGDGRRDIVRFSSANGFATEVIVSFPDKGLCYSSSKEKQIDAEYDSNGRLYLFYAASDDGESACQLYLKRSDDWSKTWRLSHNDIIGYEPLEIFLRQDHLPVVCARTLFSLHCFDVELASRTSD